MSDLAHPPLTIPAGTQVVARAAVRDAAGVGLAPAGAVGVVVAVPERVDGAYIVRLPWAEVNAWRLALHQAFDAAYAVSALPAQPASAAVDAFLIRARRSMVEA